MLGKIEDKRRSWQQRMRWLDRITDSVEMNFNKICIVKAMVFPVVMYRCESWTIKKAES